MFHVMNNEIYLFDCLNLCIVCHFCITLVVVTWLFILLSGLILQNKPHLILDLINKRNLCLNLILVVIYFLCVTKLQIETFLRR